jgi:gluconate 5-dehydrogenase
MVAMERFSLEGQVALVTGASAGGLGYWSALALAEHGADVAVSDISQNLADLETTADAVTATGRRSEAIVADVGSESDIEALVSATISALGRIDILINHSGVMLRKDAFETTLEEWDRIVRINLTGSFLLNRVAARSMVERGSGAIVNTSTIYTNIVGPIPEAAYYASKAGVANLTRGLASEWGPAGVRVNCLAPGVFYPTRMTRPLVPERLDSMAKRTMLGRLGDPERDLAGTVVWLASDASRYVTGQVIFVDGGWSAQ